MRLKNQPKKSCGVDVTSYDVLKFFGIVMMLADHVGVFYAEDWYGLRVFGFAESIWFFLIGYAGTRPIPKSWLIGGVLLIFSDVAMGGALLFFPILFTFVLIRLCITRLGSWATESIWAFLVIIIVLAALNSVTGLFFEYGTYGFICAIFGYMRRHKDELEVPSWLMLSFIAFMVLFSTWFQIIYLPLLPLGAYLGIVAGRGIMFYALYHFRPVNWPDLKKYAPGLTPVLRFCGRWTLEIYVIHMLILKAVFTAMHPELVNLFQFRLLPVWPF